MLNTEQKHRAYRTSQNYLKFPQKTVCWPTFLTSVISYNKTTKSGIIDDVITSSFCWYKHLWRDRGLIVVIHKWIFMQNSEKRTLFTVFWVFSKQIRCSFYAILNPRFLKSEIKYRDCAVVGCGNRWKATTGSGRLWQTLAGGGLPWHVAAAVAGGDKRGGGVAGFGRCWQVMAGFGRQWHTVADVGR